MRFFSICLFFILSCYASLIGQERPLSIVIIGGGPTGLAAAIEAKAAGADITVVEKREQYTRAQYVFLMESSLNLLEGWGVFVPEMIFGYEDGEKIGAMRIKYLEIALARRVAELGIPRIIGEFHEIKENRVVVVQREGRIELPYDLLVAADGTHSAVRNYLNIPLEIFGRSFGFLTLIPISWEGKGMEFVAPFRHDSDFLTKITLPSATLISVQAQELSKERLASIATELGWQREAEFILADRIKYTDHIEIVLQQALQFSDRQRSAIILGDAAASASFLQGTGANYALESAVIAGRFFNTTQQDKDYVDFDNAMKSNTDQLINENLFLFNL